MILFFIYELVRVIRNVMAYTKEKAIVAAKEAAENAELSEAQKQKAIEEKLESMRDRDLTPEKLELVENSARKAREAVNTEMFEFQKKHFEQRATLDNYEDSIKKYALELGVEKELNEINPKQVIEEFNETKNKAEKPETEKTEQDKPEQDKPEQDKPEQDKPEQDKPEQDKPEQDKPKQDKPEQDKPETEKPASGNPVPGAPTPGKTGANEIEEIVLLIVLDLHFYHVLIYIVIFCPFLDVHTLLLLLRLFLLV